MASSSLRPPTPTPIYSSSASSSTKNSRRSPMLSCSGRISSGGMIQRHKAPRLDQGDDCWRRMSSIKSIPISGKDVTQFVGVQASYEQEARFPQLRTLSHDQRARLNASFLHCDDYSFCEWMSSLKLVPPEMCKLVLPHPLSL